MDDDRSIQGYFEHRVQDHRSVSCGFTPMRASSIRTYDSPDQGRDLDYRSRNEHAGSVVNFNVY